MRANISRKGVSNANDSKKRGTLGRRNFCRCVACRHPYCPCPDMVESGGSRMPVYRFLPARVVLDRHSNSVSANVNKVLVSRMDEAAEIENKMMESTKKNITQLEEMTTHLEERAVAQETAREAVRKVE